MSNSAYKTASSIVGLVAGNIAMAANTVLGRAANTAGNAADISMAVQTYLMRGAGNVTAQAVNTNEVVGRAGGNLGAISVAAQSMLLRGAGDLTAQAVGTNEMVARAGGDLGVITIGLQSVVMRGSGNFSAQTINTNELVGRGGGNLGGIAIAEGSLVGRTSGGNLAAISMNGIAGSTYLLRCTDGTFGAFEAGVASGSDMTVVYWDITGTMQRAATASSSAVMVAAGASPTLQFVAMGGTQVLATDGALNFIAITYASAATANAIVRRDAASRAQFAAASADADALIRSQQNQRRNGVIATASLLMPNQPVAGNTIGIGADTYEFDGVGANINVVIGGNAAATRANLIAAINTQGTVLVVADEVGTTVRVRNAVSRGGAATPGEPNAVLAEAITDAADIWDVGAGTNMNSLSGESYSYINDASAELTVTAAMVTAVSFIVASFDFNIRNFTVQVRDSAGGVKYVTDRFTISGTTSILCAINGATNVANTDIITVRANA